MVRRMGLNAEHAIDCVQEALQTFLLLPQAQGLEDKPIDAARLLTTVTKNAARTMRRRVRAQHQRVEHAQSPEQLEANTELAEQRLQTEEALASLRRCVGTLSEQQRAVVTLRMLEELSGEEVAKALGITAPHVAVLLHRAKTNLRGCMATEGWGVCTECWG